MQTTASLSFPVERVAESRSKDFDFDHFTFGTTPTDHMFVAHYQKSAWQDARIQPFREIALSPFALGLHYGQTVFEGFKAFRMQDGRISIFRPERHAQRLNRSLERMCMPAVPEEMFMEGIRQLISMEQGWIPDRGDVALYIRPFVVATEARIGMKVSDEYLFMITCTPIGKYYPEPVKVKVEMQYVRAAEGGVGFAKCGGNYGASFYPARKAREEGYDQVLWTDGKHNEFIEESGTMNIMFRIGSKLITPPLNGAILDGVTRDSILQLARDKEIEIEERRVSYKELRDAFEAGTYVEAFGVGTAAVIAPISGIGIENVLYTPNIGPDALMYVLQKELSDIRLGHIPDRHHWNLILS